MNTLKKKTKIEIIFLYFKVNLITTVSTVRNVWLTYLIRTMIELEESIKGLKMKVCFSLEIGIILFADESILQFWQNETGGKVVLGLD